MPQIRSEFSRNSWRRSLKEKKKSQTRYIMAVLAKGHVLLEDVPGVGKDNNRAGTEPADGNGFSAVSSLHRMWFLRM